MGILNKIYSEYSSKFLSYLTNGLNFGNNKILPILNFTGYITGDGQPNIVVKLLENLPSDINIRKTAWITNISMVPVINKTTITSLEKRKSFKISGPNFNVKISTAEVLNKKTDYTNASKLSLSQSDQNTLNFYKSLTDLNVDYSDFSNFIIFSSAELRIKLFLNKKIKLAGLASQLEAYNSYSGSSNNSYTFDINSLKSQIQEVYSTFDGYDVYLNNQSFTTGSLTNSELTEYINSAAQYDFENRDNLVNNTPQYIKDSADNEDYHIFLLMIGHHFDNIYLYIDRAPLLQCNTATSASNDSVAAFSDLLLSQFGWKSTYGDANNIFSAKDIVKNSTKIKTISNRILNNLPILYKTKGTEECIRVLANIYGVPHNLLQIKEFGGNSTHALDTASYTYDYQYYFTKFKGGSEYILIPNSPDSSRAIEFKFRVNQEQDYPQNREILLLEEENSVWSVSIVRQVKTNTGVIKCNFPFAQIDSLIISDIPIFNGKIYSVLLNLEDLVGFDADGQAPKMLRFRVTQTENDHIVFDKCSHAILGNFDTDFFVSGSVINVGNYYTDNNFHGNIDKINIWTAPLTEQAYLDHCFNFESYNDYSPASTYKNLYFRYSTDYPYNLFSTSSFVSLPNANAYYAYNSVTGSAHNFQQTQVITKNCLPISSSSHPYQFDVVNIAQNIKTDNFGPNKYKNFKIHKTVETAIAQLSPLNKSTVNQFVTNDSNLIGVYISPFKVREDDMLNFLGNFDLMNIVGDPSNLYKNNYCELEGLRENYNTKNLAETVLYQEFYTLYKNYFDFSFFEAVKQIIPARCNLIAGLVIEPSILERSKYQNNQLVSTAMCLEAKAINKKDKIASGENLMLRVAGAQAPISKNGAEAIDNNNNFFGNYISDDKVLRRNSIYNISGSHLTFNSKTGRYENENIYVRSTKEYIKRSDNSVVTASFNNYNYATAQNNADYVSDFIAYPISHKSMAYNPLSKFAVVNLGKGNISASLFIKSQQTSLTTVDQNGIPDGSDPVQVTFVNNNINQITLTTL